MTTAPRNDVDSALAAATQRLSRPWRRAGTTALAIWLGLVIVGVAFGKPMAWFVLGRLSASPLQHC